MNLKANQEIQWILMCVNNSSDHSGVCIHTDAPSNTTYNATCHVNFTSTLMLHCPLEYAKWLRLYNGNVSLVCDKPDCEVNPTRELTNEDSGMYYCQLVNVSYYVNITVFGKVIITCCYIIYCIL